MEKAGLIILFTVAILAMSEVRGQVCTNIQSNPYTKIWTIATGHDWGAYEYINEGGYITGFSKSLIDEVCKAANINCRTIWLPYTACWQSQEGQHSYGGDGLLGRWIDACTGWLGTIDRIHVFDFSMPFLKQETAYFFYRSGSSFDKSNHQNQKIGFLDGWSSDEKCLVRQLGSGTFLPDKDNVIYYATTRELAEAINNREVDAGFSYDSALKGFINSHNLERNTADGYSCGIVGNAMMTRKDNDFIHYWNIGFMKIRNNGHFKTVCQNAANNHGQNGQIDCVET